MRAILSDIQSNSHALRAVMDELERRNIREIVCLGNLIGWGPDPRYCIEIGKSFDWCLIGHMELDILKHVLDDLCYEECQKDPILKVFDKIVARAGRDNVLALQKRRACISTGNVMYASGSPLDYTKGLMHPDLIYEPKTLNRMFEAFDGTFVCGSSTKPGVYTRDHFEFGCDIQIWKHNDQHCILDGGSVGSDDHHAQFLIESHDSNGQLQWEFVQVPYDRIDYIFSMEELFE